MSLFLATLVTGLFLIALGVVVFTGGTRLAAPALRAMRSMPLAVVLMGGALVWFLYKITQLGEADFGQYKNVLFLIFASVGGLSFFVLKDFLAVRGGAVLVILVAKILLGAAYMQYAFPQRLFLVSFIYVAIILALWVGASPFQLRNASEWILKTAARARLVGGMVGAYGVLLSVVAFTYN
ncbi:MAG: hypothetical protein SFY80_06190 [Verrucomicrobiota bacterium]|nr:hypothetical protein [Verrucomicrobiota bacterium]